MAWWNPFRWFRRPDDPVHQFSQHIADSWEWYTSSTRGEGRGLRYEGTYGDQNDALSRLERLLQKNDIRAEPLPRADFRRDYQLTPAETLTVETYANNLTRSIHIELANHGQARPVRLEQLKDIVALMAVADEARGYRTNPDTGYRDSYPTVFLRN